MTTTALEALRSMSGGDAADYFAAADPEELVALVRDASDETLLDLIGRDEIRPAAVAGILARLDEYAIPERLAQVGGVVRFDLQRRGRVIESQVLEFDHGSLRAVEPAVGPAPDVVITTSLLRFVRLVSGERNAGLEFLAGSLDIQGDELLALAVGSLFRIPGTDEVALDPTTLDPVDVAGVLRDADSAHLRRVMAGGYRSIVLDEIFRRLPEFVNPRRAAKVHLVVALRLTGRPDGGVDRHVVEVVEGRARVIAGEAEELRRDATVTCEAHEFLKLATGNLNAVGAVLKGQLKVRGDRAKALQLTSVLDIPSAR